MSGSPKQYSQAVAEPGKSPRHKLLGFAVILGALLSFAASATLEPEEMFRVEQLASREGRHIVVLGDFSIPHTTDGRAHIIDADRGDYLGVVNTGFWHGGVLLPRSKNLIVSPETYFSRGTRGKRTDIVAFYDAQTLQPLAETEIPPKRFTPVKMQASSALSDDDRFAFVLNHTPAASVSVVDVQNRVFTAEIDIPGCFNLYATGRRSFNVICANGGFLQVEVDDNGKPASLTRTEVLFN
ncbi:MAG: amine dehydrogenase, partial [Proteobacteria bacterium]|nr:amine dehydrogenase [Pseudomonadota bacterium]